MIVPLIIIGKLVRVFSRILNIGNGGTWPGEIALRFSPQIFSYFVKQLKEGIIIIAGTNGKTTTAKMIKQVLSEAGYSEKRLIHNDSGANLLNGLVSVFIQKAKISGQIEADFAIFEVDEATVPIVISKIQDQSKIIGVFLNLFRDQLDRYGEVDLIANKWGKALKSLSKEAKVILNADDPQIACLEKNTKAKILFFGLDRPEKYQQVLEHATDSIYCRNCGTKLDYKGIYFSHLGNWFCAKCGNKRPNTQISNWVSPIPGLYNEYNTLAAASVGKALKINEKVLKKALIDFSPAFGRQEEFTQRRRKIKIFLSKNPAGFNASLRTVLDLKPKVILLVLNDRIPDGKDVSWIWDVDFEIIPDSVSTIVSGDRVYDLALRIKYTYSRKFQIPNSKFPIKSKFQNSKLFIELELKKAIRGGLSMLQADETLYVLPTYSAMLEVRKIIKGRKIL